MPFEVLETITKKHNIPMATVTYMRTWSKKKDTPKGEPRLRIAIPTTLFTSSAERAVLLLGSGLDAKKLRIKTTNDKMVGVAITTLMHAVRFSFGYVPKFGNECFDTVRCPVKKINAEEFEIELPLDPLTTD